METRRKRARDSSGRAPRDRSSKRPRDAHGRKRVDKQAAATHRKLLLEKHKAASVRRRLRSEQKNFLCELKFHTELPGVPFPPKFLAIPLDHDQLTRYRTTSLEQSHRFRLHAESDLGVRVDLIDNVVLAKHAGEEEAELAAEDRALCDAAGSRSKSARYKPRATWLRKTEYINNDLFHQVHNYASEKNRQDEMAEGLQRKLEQESKRLEERSKLERIAESFKIANSGGEPKHQKKPQLKRVKEWAVLPNFEMWPNTYVQVDFDSNVAGLTNAANPSQTAAM